jgi:hypothetical protein
MKPIRISSPADAIADMGHSLGYWPQESLVCVALDGAALGPTLRVNLPSTLDCAGTYTERVAHYFALDHDATAVLMAPFTRQPWGNGRPKPFAHLVQRLKRQFSAAGLLVRHVWIVGPTSFASYDGANHTACGKETSLAALESSTLNAELVYQGSFIGTNDPSAIAELVASPADQDAVESALRYMNANPAQSLGTAYRLWMVLNTPDAEPTHDQLAEVLAGLQHVGLRDQIMADMPGLNEPMAATLFGATEEPRNGTGSTTPKSCCGNC